MDSFNLTILVLIIMIFIFSDEMFFNMIYNSKSGRFVIVVLLITISIVSIWLSFVFLMIIMYFSQFNKKTPTTEHFDKMDRVNVSDVLNNNFLYKNYKPDNVYKKSKKNGLDVIRESEKIRPKSSKFIPPFSTRPSKNVSPYSKNIYYNF